MSSKLPQVSGRDAAKAFEKFGWKVVRVGSNKHIILKKKDLLLLFQFLITKYLIEVYSEH
jgi:predicted RNA binding protein YcfA (HicA-like mRNA interferase family)